MKNRKGFTLIELLVVISIIALLLSIIMPALGKAKTYAQEVICKNSLRQYSIATEMYCNDYDDQVPNPWQSLYDSGGSLSFPGETERYCRWHNPDYNLERHPEYAGPYWQYLAVTKANVCPTFAKVATKYAEFHMEGNNGKTASDCIGGPFEPQFSYSMNSEFSIGGDNVARKSAVRSPSQTFLWAEENMWTLTGLSRYVLNDTGLVIRSDARDNVGSFHKISKGHLALQQESRDYVGKGVSDVLMVDGSVAWLTPEESLRYVGDVD